ncbi:helix-turn-helix domain-containing protein [Rothia sp. CCM 9416]|uniref:helix-turn-helix domain-containing protein n=1 Tax=Rothia sp. CCM 9416 TaxID=3402655 RepID=UPI003AEDEC99
METGNRKAAGLANAFSSRLNEEIRVWMTRRGENLRTLESATGISRSRLSRTVNRDEAPINTNELDLICKALDISPSEIIRIAEQAILVSSRPDTTGTDQSYWVKAAKNDPRNTRHPDFEEGVEYYE